MSGRARPRADDPFGLHRVAPRRRDVHHPPPPPASPPSSAPPPPAGAPRSDDHRAHDTAAAEGGLCAACPVGPLLRAWRELEPEAVDHLLAATHELLAVARAVIDAADGIVEEQRRGRRRAPRVRRLDVQ